LCSLSNTDEGKSLEPGFTSSSGQASAPDQRKGVQRRHLIDMKDSDSSSMLQGGLSKYM
jgi:hypothetical protein